VEKFASQKVSLRKAGGLAGVIARIALETSVALRVKWSEPPNTQIYAATETRSYVLSVT
jgi:hypothetical protein